MAVGAVTVTGKLGPGKSVTSLVFSNVVDLDFQFDREVIAIKQSTKTTITEFDFADIATVTFSISGSTVTVTIST